MATSTQLDQIYQYTVGLFKAAPGGYMEGLVDFVDLGYSTQEMALALANSAVFQGLYNTDSDEAFVAAYLTNLMGTTLEGKSVEIDGADVSVFDFTKDYALEMLQTQSRAQVAVALVDALAQLEGNEYYGDAYDLMMSRVDLAKGYQILGGESTNIATLQSVLGAFASSYDLTTGLDNLLGGMGNDTFVANIVGTLSTLQNGDKIDGGAGSDTLFAHINPNGLVVSAETSNVETVKFRVQADQFDSGDNNIAGVGIIDAERMVGVTTWEDNNSRADLVIEDVRILDNQITKDITIEMRDTDPGHVDFGVYFDQLSLRSVSSSDAQINLRVMDTYAVAQGLDELKDSPYGSFTFWYSLEGSDFAKVSLASEDIQNAQTYDEMRDALQAAANSVFGPGVVTVSLGSTYTVPDSVTGTDVTGTEIVLAASGNIAFDTTMAGSGWLATDTVPAISGLYTSYNTASSSSTDLVTSTIVLDNVGRGSVGGDLVVGGKSVGDTSNSQGVQQFDITVEDSSNLQTISSTNNTLQVVNIVNGVADESAYAYGDPSEGNLTVNGVVGGATGSNDALPGSTAAAGDFGFTDVRVIDGSAMTGKLEFTAEFSADSIAKYLDLEDTQAAPAGDNIAVAYDGGANDDTMLIEIDAQAVASRSTIVSGREDFTFSFDGNAGDDTIVVTVDDNLMVGGVEDWYYNQNLNNNISISGGAGDDTIWTPGAGDMTIDAGSGDDAVYTDNTGAQAAGGLAIDVVDKGAWLFNTAAQTAAVADAAAFRDLDDLRSDVNDSYNLYKATLTVTFKGIASDVITLANTATYKTTDLEINQAIKNAINNDDVLSKLLVAQDGPANSLIVKSLIDGVMTTGDLTVALAAPTAELNSTELTAVNTAWGTAYANSAAALAGEVAVVTAFNTKADYVDVLATDGTVTERTGADSTNVSDNFVTPGTGNDVIVLGTTLGAGVATSSNEVVVYNSAAFGDDVIVNFDVAGNGIDHLSFNGILGGAVSGLYGAENITNRSVTIVAETAANDSADEIKALYNAIDDATASSHLYIAYNAHNVGSVYYVVDGTGADDVTVTKYGTIDLADTAWNTITLANLTVPSVYAEGPVAAQGAILVAPAGAAALNGTAFADILDGTLGAAGIAITGLAGNDTITGATLGAVIDGGLGADAIDLTVNGVTDTVVITAGPDTIANFLVGGGAVTDDLQIDISNIEDLVVGSDYVATDGSSVAVGAAVSIQTIAAAAVIGGAADEVLFVNGDIADAAALETALEVGGGFAVTTTNAIAALDTLLVAFDNGTNSYIAAVTSTAGAASGATFAAGDLTATVLVQLTGVADVTTLLAGDFATAIA